MIMRVKNVVFACNDKDDMLSVRFSVRNVRWCWLVTPLWVRPTCSHGMSRVDCPRQDRRAGATGDGLLVAGPNCHSGSGVCHTHREVGWP